MELVNDITKKWVDSFINNPQASAIIDSNGDRKSGINVSKYIYRKLVNSEKVPYYNLDVTDKKSIGVDEVREMKNHLSLKANINGKITRFVVISSGEILTPEAQNALLKLIEELPDRTVLIIITDDNSKIINTIASRCFSIKVLPIEHSKAQKYAKKNNIENDKFERAYLMSEGNASTFLDIVQGNSEEFEKTINYAKKFISSDVLGRQRVLQKYNKDNQDLTKLVKSIQLIAKTAMRSTKKTEIKHKWKTILEKSLIAENQINSNASPKVVLLNLSVSI